MRKRSRGTLGVFAFEAVEPRILLSTPVIVAHVGAASAAQVARLIHGTAVLPSPREAMAGAAIGPIAVFAGGIAGATPPYSDEVDFYDTRTQQWMLAHLSEPRAGLASARIGGVVLFAGGDRPLTSGGSNVVDIYDSSTARWSVATLSQRRALIAAASVGGTAIFVGSSGKTEDRMFTTARAANGLWRIFRCPFDFTLLA